VVKVELSKKKLDLNSKNNEVDSVISSLAKSKASNGDRELTITTLKNTIETLISEKDKLLLEAADAESSRTSLSNVNFSQSTAITKLTSEIQLLKNAIQKSSLELQRAGKLLLIYICNFHVLSHLLLIFICKLHWNLNTMFVCQVNYFCFTYVISMS
jgi:hypothetical protein